MNQVKKHYAILDGLRGVAAIVVIFFHIFEIFSGGNHVKQLINHGYLAVDFFFLLSGFVIAHAYDDRWGKMSLKSFAKRRLIRLHPMIIVGMLIGAILFYFSASEMFPLVEKTSILSLIGITILGFLLLPIPIPMDIRGWAETFPTNGPAWSLFYEYLANIAYALVLRKLSNKILFVLLFIAAVALIHLGVTSPKGDIIGGWSLNGEQIRVGLTRLAFPFLAGILLRRYFKPKNIKNAFVLSSIILVFFLAFPRVGGEENLWMNGIYDSLVVIIFFPIIIFIGASGNITSNIGNKICKFLGDISYPLYITHFPIIYVFYAWINNNNISIEDSLPMAFVTFVICMIVAYASLKLYDIPVRAWLTKKFITKN